MSTKKDKRLVKVDLKEVTKLVAIRAVYSSLWYAGAYVAQTVLEKTFVRRKD